MAITHAQLQARLWLLTAICQKVGSEKEKKKNPVFIVNSSQKAKHS